MLRFLLLALSLVFSFSSLGLTVIAEEAPATRASDQPAVNEPLPPPKPPAVRNLRDYRAENPNFDPAALSQLARPVRDYTEARRELMNIKRARTNAERAANLDKAKAFAQSLMSRLADQLTKVKANIQNSSMKDERKARLLAQIDAQLEKIAELTAIIEEATSADQLKKLVQRVREAARTVRFSLKHHLGLLRVNQLQHAIEQHQNLADRLEKIIDDLKTQGINTAELERLLTGIKNRLSSLRTSAANTEGAYENLTAETGFDSTSDSAEAVTSQTARL